MTIPRKKIPISTLEKIDEICLDFERCWQRKEPPTIESALSNELCSDGQELLFSELLMLEIDYRRRIGEFPLAPSYLERFPGYGPMIQNAFRQDDKKGRRFELPSTQRIAELFPALEIESMLGAGGMGAVYKARQKGLDRQVALKILPEELGHDVKFALRFTREARTLARLSHPNIVSVFEFGNVEDIYFFMMEYVDGSTLRDVVRMGQLEPEHALAIVPHLCDALQYAHEQGVVHRDIKPENILMGKDGAIKIADFGLSRIIASDNQSMSLTQTHQVLGTPKYMAPEQFESSHGVDHRADIYSLGVVFYEMLTGELPVGRFEVPSRKVQVDVRLDEVVLRTLEREPSRRYQAASEIKSDLDSIVSGPGNTDSPTKLDDSHRDFSVAQHFSVRHERVENQATAAQLILSRRELVGRVTATLNPLRRKLFFQILFGVGLIALGAQCWARNIGVPHRLISGLIVHVYGIVLIGAAAHVWTRIGLLDFAQPVTQILESLNQVRKSNLLGGPLVGFPWWLMWIPVAVSAGLDVVLHPNSFWISSVVGVSGWLISMWLFLRAVRANEDSEAKWEWEWAGGSISGAYALLKEMENAKID
ncbi:MAG: serine/threonine-protein kinase [Planctomycetota bacterium]